MKSKLLSVLVNKLQVGWVFFLVAMLAQSYLRDTSSFSLMET